MSAAGLRLLHLADVHLGAALPWLAEQAPAHRQQIRETFAAAVRHGAQQGARVILIAGDLFASPRPDPDLTTFVASTLAPLGRDGIETVIAAGAHDAPPAGTPYARGGLADLPGVTILPAEPSVIELPAVGIAVTGQSYAPGQDPLTALRGPARLTQPWTVGLLHVPPDQVGEAIPRLAWSGLAYLALGGSHKTSQVTIEGLQAWYPGSPELVEKREAGGAALLVELSPGGALVRPLPVATRRFARITLVPASFASTEALTQEIEGYGDPHLILEVLLTGVSRPSQYVDVREMQQRLRTRFMHLDIADESLPDLASADAIPVLPTTVHGRFLGSMAQQLHQAATPAERRRIGAALRLGLWLLEHGVPPEVSLPAKGPP